MKVELRQVRHQQAMGRELGFAFATLVYFPRRHLHNRIHGRLKAMIRAQNNQERNRKTKFQCPKSREYPAAIHTTSSTTLSPHSATSWAPTKTIINREWATRINTLPKPVNHKQKTIGAGSECIIQTLLQIGRQINRNGMISHRQRGSGHPSFTLREGVRSH